MRQTRKMGPKLCMLCILILGLAGCASHYVKPEPQKVNPDLIPAFTSTKTYKVVNNQPLKKYRAVGRSGIGTFYVSLQHFTDEVAKLLTDELTNHGMQPAEDAEKVIYLAITDVTILDRFVYNCVLKMEMETSNGNKNTYTANQVSGHGHHVWGGAITSMVTELLNDYAFIDYLKE